MVIREGDENPAAIDVQANLRLEYELIQRTRMNWTDAMMRWRNIVIPLAGSLIVLSTLKELSFWVIGWLVGLGVLVYWLYIEKHIDEQIKALYLRILDLENILGMTFYSHYLFNNRNGKRYEEARQMSEFNYQEFRAFAFNHPSDFVGSRGTIGHKGFVIFYFVIGIITFAILVSQGYYSQLTDFITLMIGGASSVYDKEIMMAIITASAALVGLQGVVLGQMAQSGQQRPMNWWIRGIMILSFVFGLLAITFAINWLVLFNVVMRALSIFCFAGQTIIFSGVSTYFWMRR